MHAQNSMKEPSANGAWHFGRVARKWIFFWLKFHEFDSFSKTFRNCLKSMLLMLCDCSVCVCVREGGINISINVATVPASELPKLRVSTSYSEFRLWKTPGKLLYLCALILQAQSFRRSFAFPLLMAAPFCCRSRSHCRCCYTPYTWQIGRRGYMEWKVNDRIDVGQFKASNKTKGWFFSYFVLAILA